MTKRREPISIDTALARIAGQDGVGSWAGMADATGYAERTVRAWGDPDRDEVPPLPACVVLGILYRKCGGVGDPLLQAHADLIGAAESEAFGSKQELRRETLDFFRETNEANLALLEAAEPDAGDAEQARATKEVLDVRNWADRLLGRLSGRTRAPP